MTRVTRKSTAFGIVLLFGLFANQNYSQPASAATDCSTARQVAVSTALGRGDTATASRAQGLCNNPCTSIESFYNNYSGYLNSSYAEGVILGALKTCIANQSNNNSGNNSGGNISKPVKFKTVKAPAVSGSVKVGQTVKAIKGKWSTAPKFFYSDWYVCSTASTKAVERVVSWEESGFMFAPPKNCGSEPILRKDALKLTSKHKGKHLVLCQDVRDDSFCGYFCTKSIKVS